jgi:hypothetical protein
LLGPLLLPAVGFVVVESSPSELSSLTFLANQGCARWHPSLDPARSIHAPKKARIKVLKNFVITFFQEFWQGGKKHHAQKKVVKNLESFYPAFFGAGTEIFSYK